MVNIRMYRHGLGDCFLLTFSRAQKKYHILIDCGVIVGTENPREIMKKVAEDIKKTTKGKIDLLVITHEHADHLSGFNQAREVFDSIKIENVWFAWTEDPQNELANHLRKERKKKKKAIKMAYDKMVKLYESSGNRRGAEIRLKEIGEVLSFTDDMLGAGGKALTIYDALSYVAERGGSNIKYCYPGDKPLKLPGKAAPADVKVYVLGPPEDETLIKKSDPSKKEKEVYLRASALSTEDCFFMAVDNSHGTADMKEFEKSYPFDKHHRIEKKDAGNVELFKTKYGLDDISGDKTGTKLPLKSDDETDNKWRRIEADWLGITGELALALDGDTNNTSLVLAIEIKDEGKVLLFPGDAQVGNWLSWEKCEWKTNGKGNKEKVIKSADLLARTVFYKVGHHGSHNATLKDKGLELMTNEELTAMIPVDVQMARKKVWNEMPYKALVNRLMEKTSGRVIQMDKGILPSKDKDKKPEFSGTVKIEDLYIDYTIK